MITKDNYEAYLLDYWEGNLSKEDAALLADFFRIHPDLATELPDEIPVIAQSDSFNFDPSSIKYEEINTDNCDYFLIAKQEGVISPKEDQLLQNFLLDHPEVEARQLQYKKAVLSPPKVTWEDKKKLYFENNKRPLFYRIAAAVLFILGIAGATQWYLVSTGSKSNGEFAALSATGQFESNNLPKAISFNPIEEYNHFKSNKNDLIKNEKTQHADVKKKPLNEKKMFADVQKIVTNPQVNISTKVPSKTLVTPNFPLGDLPVQNEFIAENNQNSSSPQTIAQFLIGKAQGILQPQKELPDDGLDKEQSLLALGVNKSLDWVTGGEQEIAATKDGRRRTFLSIGGFSFEKTSAAK